jgi:hypothetical protein
MGEVAISRLVFDPLPCNDTYADSMFPAPENRNDFFGPDKEWAYPFNFFGDIPYFNVTAEFDLGFGGLSESVKVSDVLQPLGDSLCYQYA